jgi:hypothetical protein
MGEEDVMVLFIQIFLTTKAFRNGWRYWVIVPWAILGVASMIVGAASVGADPLDIAGLGFLLDLGLVGALAYMSMRERGGYVPGPTDTEPIRFFGRT